MNNKLLDSEETKNKLKKLATTPDGTADLNRVMGKLPVMYIEVVYNIYDRKEEALLLLFPKKKHSHTLCI